MVYEYDNNELSQDEIKELLYNAKTPVKNILNLASYVSFFLMIVLIIISFIHYDYKWNNRNFILIAGYLLVIIYLSLRKKVNLSKTEENENKRKMMKQCVEVNGYIYRYKNQRFTALLSKDTILEIIMGRQYTLIFIKPKRLKSIIYIPIFIPNNLFGSEEKYNEFIKNISE